MPLLSLLKLRLTIVATLAFLIGLSTLLFTVILAFMGVFNVFIMIPLVVGFNLLQWYFGPGLIERMYRVKEMPESSNPKLHSIVRRIADSTRITRPRLMYSEMSIPNAFAYGSPRGGNRVAVTRGLLNVLEEEEVEAVLGHELGHLKHRDVQIMMFASVLPSIFYYIGFSLMLSSFFGGRGRGGGGGSGGAMIIGLGAMVAYFVLSIVVMGLSRLREYYADQHAVQHVPDGARKLSEGLAKIVTFSENARAERKRGKSQVSAAGFKTLLFSDPDSSHHDISALDRAGYRVSDSQLVHQLATRELSFGDRVLELLGTHPNMVKRLRALAPKSRGD